MLALTVLFGMGAMSIDAASWYVTRHQAQVSADSAALAAANCLANAGSGQTCTSTTDTTDAAQVATTFAQDNNVPLSSVSFGSGSVTVATQTTAPKVFAGLLKLGTPTANGTAVASYSGPTPSPCDAASETENQCDAIFAAGTCAGGDGVSVSSLFGGHVNGAIVSDGSLSISGGLFFSINGNTYYGPSSNGCSYAASYHLFDFFASVPHPEQLSSNLTYPEDWRTGGNETVPPCTFSASSNPGFNHTYWGGFLGLSFTNIVVNGAGTNITITGDWTIPDGVYCAPSGTISIADMTGGHVTFVANSISALSGFSSFEPCTSATDAQCPASNSLLMYQTGSSPLNIGSVGTYSDGTIFAPSADVDATSIGSGYGFLEGQSVSVTGLFTGDGPQNPDQPSQPGNDALSN